MNNISGRRKIMLNKFIIQILIIFTLVTILSIFLFPSLLNADDHKVWVDTSHWEYVPTEWVKEGHWETVSGRRWVDTSYTVHQGYWQNYTENVWVDTSHWEYGDKIWVDNGYWKVTDYKVWVAEGHLETRYRYVNKWVPCNKIFYYGTDSYGWSVYSGFSKYIGRFEGTINGNKYKYKKLVIDYRPIYGGRVYAIKYECYEVLKSVLESYRVWVDTSHWETQRRYEWVDTSHWEYKRVWVTEGHWETVSGRRWVDTSYTVHQGYWQNYTENVWVDTSHWEYENKWVEDGFYTSPLHGELIVEKDPEYVFTKWHEDKYNNECSMNLGISWKVDNSNLSEGEEEKKIVRLYIYEDVCRFNDKGLEKVIIFNGNVSPAIEGNIDTVTKFEYSGSEESLIHIYLFAQNGESAHIYFSNPINGFRSINLMPEGSSTNANVWLGGISHERFEF
jgi:hypothetical protein